MAGGGVDQVDLGMGVEVFAAADVAVGAVFVGLGE